MRKNTVRAYAARRRREAAALNRLIALAGGQQAVGDWFGVKYQAVQGWLLRGVPMVYLAEMERRSGGAVQVWELDEEWDAKTSRPFARQREAEPS